MLRLSSYLALAFAVCLFSTRAALAEDETWTVTEVMGAASVVSPMVAGHAVKKGEMLAPGATLTTGADGKVVFGDGKTQVTVNSNSRLTMPADPSDTMTRFAQDLGSVFFKVEKRPMQHFEVQTPLIAAVVKGTQFTVTAGAMEHAVDVTEGLVEVVAMTGGQKELVPAGKSARVRSDAPAKLKLAGDPQSLGGGAITRAIGAEPIDYAVVTDGLVAATPVVVSTLTRTEGGSSESDKEVSATAGGTVAAVEVGTGAVGGVVADVDVGLGDAAGGGGVSVGADAGAGSGGGGGVGAGVDLGAGTGGGGTGVSVDVGAGSGGVGIGGGVTGGTPSGSSGGSGGSSGGSGGIGIGVGAGTGGSGGTGGIGIGVGGGTPPGQIKVRLPGTGGGG
jgi:hypothetical protein